MQKVIAQPEVDPNPPQATVTSTRDVGHHWKETHAASMPTLFGGGGHMDGATALIQTSANIQKEDECALHGTGDDTIDSNRFQRNQANANTEFNFSQYKVGVMGSQRGGILPGEGRFSVTNTDGAAMGDQLLKVDPYSDMVDVTTQALGFICDDLYRDPKSNAKRDKPSIRENPFKRKSAKKPEDVDVDMTAPEAEVEEDDGYDIDYYYNDAYYGGDVAERAVQDDSKTGLRRVNTKTSQGRQLEAVATSDQIHKAYQQANEHYAMIVKDYGRGYMSTEDRKTTRDKLRVGTSKYQTTQVGVNDLSRETASKHKGNNGNKLNTQLVGV